MKKGKPNLPPHMRGQFNKQKELATMREQMLAASRPGKDGLPVFNLFVRTKRANVSDTKLCFRCVWYGRKREFVILIQNPHPRFFLVGAVILNAK
jgi:hypothetical protein